MSDKIKKTLQIIKNNKSLENHLFKKLSNASKPLEWLEPLNQAGYFDPSNQPTPKKSKQSTGYYYPTWNVLSALENMAKKNETSPIDDISKKLQEIINRIIDFKENNKKSNNYRTDWYLLKILSHFPVEYIEKKHIQFIKEGLISGIKISPFAHDLGKQFLPKIIKNRKIKYLLNLLESILDYRKPSKEGDTEYKSIMDSYYLKECLDNNKEDIAILCPIEAAKIAITKMREILKEHKSQFNAVWIPAIEDHEQTMFPDRYSCQIIYFVRDMLEDAEADSIISLVQNMLNEKHPIFKRLAYHLINNHYNSISDLFWDIEYNPLNIVGVHELYKLLDNNSKKFNKKQINKIINWIKNQEIYLSEQERNNPKKIKSIEAYEKKKWLLPLLDSGNDIVLRKYQKYNNIYNKKIEHPGFDFWHGDVNVEWTLDSNKVDISTLEENNNKEVADFIISYDKDNRSKQTQFYRPNPFFREMVFKNPENFSTNLEPFKKIPKSYQYELLDALKQAWKKGKIFDWEEILNFIKDIVQIDNFSNEQETKGYHYNKIFVKTVLRLIQEGIKNDNNAFSPDYLNLAEEIILLLMRKVEYKMSYTENGEFVNSVINSAKGLLYITAVEYSLHYARLYRKNKDNKWKKSIKTEFTKQINRQNEKDLEFSIVMGWFYRNLLYLDKEWAEKYFNNIFDINNNEHWEAAFTSYLTTNSQLYEKIYNLFRSNRHYQKGLDYSFNNKNASKKIIQNIVLGYLVDWDELSDSNGLIIKLINKDKPDYLLEIVSFIYRSRDQFLGKYNNKIKPLWSAIFNKTYSRIEKKEYKAIAQNLFKWITVVDEIDDDIYNWLNFSAKHIYKDIFAGFILEDMIRHVKKTPEKIGDLYCILLNNEIYPEYKKGNIIKFVDILYKNNKKDIANRICNRYLKMGYEFLMETFEKYNKNDK
ncbi:MAG: hypothetical protein K9M80_06345 [Candidatus Marinimicrobia bacterium]|nr:hypothetical protein [Candidatus Neomarinimicrobiota bacterium]